MAGSIKATPRKKLPGTIADVIKYVDSFARKPFGYENPPAEMISDFIGIPAIQKTIDRISYGEPLTTGRGMTTRINADAADAAMAVAPAVAKFPKQALSLAGLAAGSLSPSHISSAAVPVLFNKVDDFKKVGKRILDDGTVIFDKMPGGFNSLSDFKDMALELAREKFSPKYDHFFRMTNNKKEIELAKSGALRNSKNHAEGFLENGLSVADGPHYSVNGYKYAYPVRGKVIGYGSDGEPLLDPKEMEILSKITTTEKLIAKDRKLQADILKRAGLPSDYFDGTASFANDQYTFLPK